MFSSLLSQLTYFNVFLLMTVESTFIPFPSEIVLPPAAYHAAANGEQNVFLLILVSTLGAVVGACINYVLACYLGRPMIYKFVNSRWGHMCLLNQEKIEKSEKYFNDHGVTATLTGRLVPVVRQLISVPAGLARMNIAKFLLFTAIGAGAWNCVLAGIGYYLHSFVPEDQLAAKIDEYSNHIKLIILGIIALVAIYFVFKHYVLKKK